MRAPMACVNSTSLCSADSLATFTSSALMVPELRGADVTAILAELSEALQREARIPELLPFYHAVLNREYLSSTTMNDGFAFPHARLHGLKTLGFALGRSPKPIFWGGRHSAPVRLVFLSAVPATEATAYLGYIAALSRLSREPHQIASLLAAPDAEAMLSILQQIKLRSGAKSSTR
jgi:mannitol/fructose-specific phosphotransferase system IIA component (Ntr-type)